MKLDDLQKNLEELKFLKNELDVYENLLHRMYQDNSGPKLKHTRISVELQEEICSLIREKIHKLSNKDV